MKRMKLWSMMGFVQKYKTKYNRNINIKYSNLKKSPLLIVEPALIPELENGKLNN